MRRITVTITDSTGALLATGSIPADWLRQTALGTVGTTIRCDPPDENDRGIEFLRVQLDPPS